MVINKFIFIFKTGGKNALLKEYDKLNFIIV